MNDKQIIDYQVIYISDMLKRNGDKLAEKVKQEMEKGWVPFGGPSIDAPAFFQAMVKHAEN